jgi:hypothetical protein
MFEFSKIVLSLLIVCLIFVITAQYQDEPIKAQISQTQESYVLTVTQDDKDPLPAKVADVPPEPPSGSHNPTFIERPVLAEIAPNLVYFYSTTELEDWLAEDDTNEWTFVTNYATKTTSMEYIDDCDDYALRLQRNALADGYILSVTVIKQNGLSHMVNSAVIDGAIWYIEPQTDEIWFFSSLD